MLVSSLEEFGLAERTSPPWVLTPQPNPSYFQYHYKFLSFSQFLRIHNILSSQNFPSPCLYVFFPISYQSSSHDPTVGRLRAAPHKYALSSLVGFGVLTKFLRCWVHQDPWLLPSPVLKLEEPISSPTPSQPLAPPFPFPACFCLDSLALLINYQVHLAIMLRRTVRPKRDCVAHLVCAPCRSCSVFLRRGCEIVRVLIILFYKGIKGAAGRVGPYFHSCSRSGVYSHTDFFLVLLWIYSIIKTVKRLL